MKSNDKLPITNEEIEIPANLKPSPNLIKAAKENADNPLLYDEENDVCYRPHKSALNQLSKFTVTTNTPKSTSSTVSTSPKVIKK